MTPLLLSLTFALLTLGTQERMIAPGADNFAAAKVLYASGAYEEALSRLPAAAEATAAAGEVDQFRALCLLALGRSADAERSLEELVARRPLFKMSDADVSPRLVAMFDEVRRRRLPAAARGLYATAKTSFEQKLYTTASSQLKDLLTLLADEDLGSEAIGLADLKLVAEGFLTITEIELAASAKADAAATAASAAAASAAPAPPSTRIYSDGDKDVTAPIEIVRALPLWQPPNTAAKLQEYRGVLRIVVNEQGRVEYAALVESVSEVYDSKLLIAARQWQFQPAVKNGEAVKYQKLISIVLKPR